MHTVNKQALGPIFAFEGELLYVEAYVECQQTICSMLAVQSICWWF